MSKYIKTKNGVYEIKDGKFLGYNVDFYAKYNFTKQADTIEELCDIFIVMKNNKPVQCWLHLDALKLCSGYFVTNDFSDVYGAIWTDKGLYYVAKLNDKGDLELLWN